MINPSLLVRRITRMHNSVVVPIPDDVMRSGGVMVFNSDGVLVGAAAVDSFDFPVDLLVYPMRRRKVTYAEVQAWLDARAA